MKTAATSLNRVVVLHNIRSLHNVGSIFRTADGAGFGKIYLCGITPLPVDRFERLQPDFAKVALGAEKSVAWEKAARTAPLLKRLKREGFKIFAVEQDPRSLPYGRWPRPGAGEKIALVMGAEVEGLPKKLLDQADRIFEIPMRGTKESLNVAVAFGIAAYGVDLPNGKRGEKRKRKNG